jgi:hypothetical protein
VALNLEMGIDCIARIVPWSITMVHLADDVACV